MAATTIISGSILTHANAYKPTFSPSVNYDTHFFDEGPRVFRVSSSVSPPNWRTMANYTAWWAEKMVLGPKNDRGGPTSIQTWIDGTGNGINLINTDEPSPENVPVLGSINNRPCAVFSRTQQTVMVSADPPIGYPNVITGSAGWICAAVELLSAVNDDPNALLDCNLFGDSTGYLQIGFRATGPALVATITDTNGYQSVQSTHAATSGSVLVYEVWWDGVNIYCRVNGGATSSHPCLGMQSVLFTGAATSFFVGKGYDAFLQVTNYGGWLDANICALATAKGQPANAQQIVAAMLAEFTVAKPVDGTIDTSTSDPFVQGVEITQQAQHDAGFAKIWSGEPGHKLVPLVFGQDLNYFAEPGFQDMDRFNPATFIRAQSKLSALWDDVLTFPIVTGDSDQLEFGLYNGVIEPLTIRSRAAFTSIDVPFEAHEVRGTMMAGNDERLQGSDRTLTIDYFLPRNHIVAYQDCVDTFNGRPSPGFFTFDHSKIVPFVDAMYTRNALAVASEDAGIVGSMKHMTGSTGNYLGINQRSSTCGWVYDDNTSVGTDSLAFGGMTH